MNIFRFVRRQQYGFQVVDLGCNFLYLGPPDFKVFVVSYVEVGLIDYPFAAVIRGQIRHGPHFFICRWATRFCSVITRVIAPREYLRYQP